MQILADENIPGVREVFAALGEVRTLPGRRVTAAELGDAEILLVRSVTSVDRSLLTGSKLRFVGSATAGTDHIDLASLQERGIRFAYAPGSNARSAAEYVIAALMALEDEGKTKLAGKTAGIIGCGNVGSRVASRLQALGLHCRINDPPLAQKDQRRDFVNLETIAACDIVSVHVPLTTAGPHPTRRLLDRRFFDHLKPGAIFINNARGAVVAEEDLRAVVEQRHDLRLVLDVWAQEPDINLELLQRAHIATPHIAGYSFDAKLRGTQAVYRAACACFDIAPAESNLHKPLPALSQSHLRPPPGMSDDEILRRAVLSVYDPRQDDARLRHISSLPAAQRGAFFDELRKTYPPRRELDSLNVDLFRRRAATAEKLRALGCEVLLRE